MFLKGAIRKGNSVADPGFPVGGGGADLPRGCFFTETYVKMKELGPVGGGGGGGERRAGGAPGSAKGYVDKNKPADAFKESASNTSV